MTYEQEMRHRGLVTQLADLQWGPLGPVTGTYRIIIEYIEEDNETHVETCGSER